MTRAPFPQDRGNLLLASLDDEERGLVLEGTSIERHEREDVLFEANAPIGSVFMPLSGMVSLVTTFSDGSKIEIATIGLEGVVGVPRALGDGILRNVQAVVQVPGETLRMEAEAFAAAARGDGRFGDAVEGYSQLLFSQVARSAACNRLHELAERCARWLLFTHDRCGEPDLPLTHEFLSEMLGVHRPTVTVAPGCSGGQG